MPLNITASFAFSTDTPTDMLLQFEAAEIDGQRVIASETQIPDSIPLARVAAEESIGERIGFRSQGRIDVQYSAQVDVVRDVVDLSSLQQLPPHVLPAEAVRYLLDSQYCPADKYREFVADQFGGTDGGSRALAIRDWIAANFSYVSGASGPETTGADSFASKRGVCRDYAHVLVMLARASMIPARYVSCYGPNVTPQDFHAVAEVFLVDEKGNGAWHLVDATMMASPDQIAVIGVGRDAADVSFLTSFGPSTFLSSKVSVSKV